MLKVKIILKIHHPAAIQRYSARPDVFVYM